MIMGIEAPTLNWVGKIRKMICISNPNVINSSIEKLLIQLLKLNLLENLTLLSY